MRSLIAILGLALAVFSATCCAQTVSYVHADALGSIVAVTDQSRNVVERREYEPFGLQLTPAIQDGPGYTKHVQDEATGLTYMQQRYYDPATGRFLSVDPVGPLKHPINHFGRYQYANNSPYTFLDPNGLYACNGGPDDCKAFQRFVGALKAVHADMDVGSASHDRLGKVLSAIGELGDNNGLTIMAGPISGGALAKLSGPGLIRVDMKQLASVTTQMQAINPTLSRSIVSDAVGAGTIAHEASHHLDSQSPGSNSRNFLETRAARFSTEMRAYRIESKIYKHFGVASDIWWPGISEADAQGAIVRGADGSVNFACATTAAGVAGC